MNDVARTNETDAEFARRLQEAEIQNPRPGVLLTQLSRHGDRGQSCLIQTACKCVAAAALHRWLCVRLASLCTMPLPSPRLARRRQHLDAQCILRRAPHQETS